MEANLDDTDVRLLDALQRDARSTLAELGSAIDLKPPAVHERLRRLEQRGYIAGYAARLDARKLGLGLIAFVSAYMTPDVNYDAFYAAIARLPEVLEVHSVAAEESFIIKVITRSTGHLDDFLARLKALAGVARTKTTIVLTTPFERHGMPLAELIAR